MPDQDPPVSGYDALTVDEVVDLLEVASPDEVREIKTYERAHKARKTIVDSDEASVDEPDRPLVDVAQAAAAERVVHNAPNFEEDR